MAKFSVILPAAGSSSRFGKSHQKKPFVNIGTQAIWLYAAQKFIDRKDVAQIIVVISKEDEDFFRTKFNANLAVMDLTLVIGGKERTDSVRNALNQVNPTCDYIAIHDAARPCIRTEWIDAVFDEATLTKAAILATPIFGTIKRVDQNRVTETVPRAGLWQAQTPQVFQRDLLLDAYEKYSGNATDDAQVVESSGHPVSVVECPASNLKVTTREDLKLAESIIKSAPRKNVLSEFTPAPGPKAGSLDDLLG